MVENQTQKKPRLSSSYEDLWLFTLANYHAGPGCLSEALGEVHARNRPLTWELVSMELEEVCSYAIDYVLQTIK